MKQIAFFLLALLLLLSACAAPATETTSPPKTPQELQPTPGSDALFVVIKPDGSEVSFTWDDLKKLPLAQMEAEGKVEEGVKLMDVLSAAGVTEFSEVNLSGSSNPASLTWEQIQDETTILDFTNHGTVKLSTNYIPKANWTKDVARIEVK
ncbi:MAG: hypothetical protein L6461_13005 [Anaerolineae bacterium]|nr:hypothetical protein [Anaerolineae bacterium]